MKETAKIIERFLHAFILWLLTKRSMHVYEMVKLIRRDGVLTSYARVHPILKELERRGFASGRIEKVGGRKRKVYTITERGRTALKIAKEKYVVGLKKEYFKFLVS